MAMIKVFYPGPTVPEAEHKRPQNHLHLGLVAPGWNEAQDDENTLAALEAGLVRLDDPQAAAAPKTGKAKATTDVQSAPSAPQE